MAKEKTLTSETLPEPRQIAGQATAIYAALTSDHEFPVLTIAALEWKGFSGYPVVALWDRKRDAPPLLREGLRALALKAAVYTLTGDDRAAEIPIPVPVDEMVHAIVAQTQVLTRIAEANGFGIIHQSDLECTDYQPGDYTHACYLAAWGEPPERYWLDHKEVERRLAMLERLHSSIGISPQGHKLDFEDPTTA